MSFESQKRKILTLREKSIKDQIRIERQIIKNNLIDERLDLLPPSQFVVKRILDQTKDWQDMKTQFTTDIVTQEIIPDYERQFLDWTIDIGEIDIRLLSFLEVMPILRFKEPLGDFEIDLELNRWLMIFLTEELSPESEIKKRVTLKASANVTLQGDHTELPGDNPIPVEAKLIVSLQTPYRWV